MQKKYNLALSPLSYAILAVLASSHAMAYSNVDISPTPGVPLPTTVYPGSEVSAFYTVTNQTRKTLTGYTIQGQPSTVTQNSSGNNCPNPIHLVGGGHCILELNISGEAISTFALCKGANCTTAAVPLHVELVPRPMIAVGAYLSSSQGAYPLLAKSSDGEIEWTYPPSIISQFPAGTHDGIFNSASCSGSYCIAVGEEAKNDSGGSFPLLAQSSDGGVTWTYPPSINTLPAGFQNGFFTSSSCSGRYCIAVGEENGEDEPLLAQSSDGGVTWAYPPSIISALPAGFDNGFFISASCSGRYCIAAGEENGEDIPLLAQSSDGGVTWTYPRSIVTQLPEGFAGGVFKSASCNGSYCIAVGQETGRDTSLPLLAQSSDGGVTWTYPRSIVTELPEGFSRVVFTSASCSGSYCIAVGGASGHDRPVIVPLLAQSSDGGVNWTYPPSIISELPEDFHGLFTSASCSGSYCIAAGEENEGDLPLLAQSSDGGVTWTYPSSIISQLPAGFHKTVFNGASCSGSYCIAVGLEKSNPLPLLAQSSDGGVTWTYPSSIISQLPAGSRAGAFVGGSLGVASLLPNALKFIYDSGGIHRK